MNKNQNQQFDEDKYQNNSSINLNRQSYSIKKSSRFYIHEYPKNLNYYSRFSPNRKQIKDEQQLIKTSRLCKSYQKSYKSSSIKSSRMSSQQKQNNIQQNYVHFINQAKNYINIQDDSQNEDDSDIKDDQQEDYIKICNINQNRGDIYIDQEDEQYQENCYQNVLGEIFIKDQNYDELNFNTNIIQYKIIESYQSNQSDQAIKNKYQQKQLKSQQKNNKNSYNLQEDQGHVYPSQGTQIFIEQDDDDDQENYKQQQITSNKYYNYQPKIKQCQYAELIKLKQTDSYISNKERIQSKSQNISFSFQSDLSMIQQKWNSYFQSDDNQATQNNNNNPSIMMTSFQSPKIIKVLQNSYKNQQNIHNRILDDNQNKDDDSSSDDELPSFSTPNTSAYKNQYLQNYEWQSPKVQQKINDQNGQKRQLKRHYTFGHQLNKAFQQFQDDQNNNVNHDSIRKPEPLFKKLISNRILQTFKEQKKQKNTIKKQKSIQNLNLNQNKLKSSTRKIENNQKIAFLKQILSKEKNQDKKRKQVDFNDKNINKNNQQKFLLNLKVKQKQNKNKNSEINKQQKQQEIKNQSNAKQNQQNQKKQYQQETILKKQKNVENNKFITIQDEHQDEEFIKRRHQNLSFYNNSIQQQKSIDQPNSYSKVHSIENLNNRTRKGSYKYLNKKKRSYWHNNSDHSAGESEDEEQMNSETGQQDKYFENITFQTPNKQYQDSLTTVTEYQQNFIQKAQIYQKELQNRFIAQKFQKQKQVEDLKRYLSLIQNSSKQKEKKIVEQFQQKALIQKKRQITKQNKKQQNYTQQIKNKQTICKKQDLSLSKCLLMLQKLIPHLPSQLNPTYEKIYSQIYQQQLKYQHKFQKQAFLINLMQQLILGTQNGLDCQSYLIKKRIQQNKMKKDNICIDKDFNEQLIELNQFIIMSLIKKIAQKLSIKSKKQNQFPSQLKF